MERSLPAAAVLGTAAAAFVLLSVLERLRPLRPRVEPSFRHLARNLATGGLAFAVVTLLQTPVLLPVARLTEARGLGIVHWLGLPAPARLVAAFLLLDYTLWVWHWLNHRAGVFWRFHLVHHADLDLDASTGFRFHFGELALSVFWRATQVLVIGAEPLALSTWQAALAVSVLFHHSNLRLPLGVERVLVLLVPTPRMHGIHHSTEKAERDTNYASLLTVWDRLHATLKLDVPQEQVRIGVPPLLEPSAVGFLKVQALPFRRRPPGQST